MDVNENKIMKLPKYVIQKTYILRVVPGLEDLYNFDGIMFHSKWEAEDFLKEQKRKRLI